MPIDTDNTQDTGVSSTSETEEQEQEKPSYMTAEQFNKALSSREKAFEKRLAQQQSKFEELLTRLAPPPKEEKELSRTAELEKTVKELSRSLQERDSRERDQNLRRMAEQTALQFGIDPEYREHALAYLIDHKKAIRYDSDGSVIFELNGQIYDSVEDGMAAWANSKDAKAYKKPTGAHGSGDGNRRNPMPNVTPQGQLDLKRRENWQETRDIQGKSALTLDQQSKIALSQLVAQKLKK